MKMKKWMSILIATILAIIAMVMTVTTALALNNTHDNLVSAGFTPVEKKEYQTYYTLLNISGYDYPVLAFESAENGTQFRIYGKIGKKEGYFPVKVEVAGVGSEVEHYVITVIDPEPVKNDKKMLAKLNAVACQEVPEGCVAADKKGTAVKLQNIFGQTETYVYGTYNDPNSPEAVYGWYKAKNANAIAGSLRYDMSDAKLRAKPSDVKKRVLPKELKKGFSQKVMFTCSNSFSVTDKTFYPEIDYRTLQEEILEEQRTKTGTFVETETEEIPYETELRKNKNLYVTEENILQTGENGIREVTWKVSYKNGEETKRVKGGTAVIKKPVKEIIERGTKAPAEAYVFSEKMNIDVSVSNMSPVEGGSFSAECIITGNKPENGYTASLTVYGDNGAAIGRTNAQNAKPGKVSCRDLAAGTYKVVAEATAAGGEVIRASKLVTVGAKVTETTASAPSRNTGTKAGNNNTKQSKEADRVHQNTGIPSDAASSTVIATRTVTERQDIPYSTEYLTDVDIFEDAAEVVVRDGIKGKRVITYEVTSINGVETARELLSDTVSVQPVSRQIKRGVKKHVTEVKIETVTETIPVETVYIDDDTRYTDDPQEVISAGCNGERLLSYNVTYLDGIETKREKTDEKITKEMISAQIKRGTMQHVYTYDEYTVTETIPYTIKYIETDQLEVGEEVCAQDGMDGEKQTTYRITYTDGQETKREVVSETITKEPVNDTCYRGTFVPTYEYEFVDTTFDNVYGTRDEALDAACREHAMNMAVSGEVRHSGNDAVESVGGFGNLEDVSSDSFVVYHAPISTSENYGAGIVKRTKHWADGGTSELYFACVEGTGSLVEVDESGEYYYVPGTDAKWPRIVESGPDEETPSDSSAQGE